MRDAGQVAREFSPNFPADFPLPKESWRGISGCTWQLRSSVLTGCEQKNNRGLLAIPGSSVPACAPVLQLENGGYFVVFPLFVIPAYLKRRLRGPRINLLLMYNSCQIRAQGPWRPLAANITQIIMGLMVPEKFFVPSFPFLSAQSNPFREDCAWALQLLVTYRLVLQSLNCLQELEGDSARDKSIC